MPTVASLTARVGADVSGLTAGLRTAEGKVKSFADRMNNLGTRLTVGVTAPLVGLAVASVRSATQMDSLKRGLTAVAGSAAEAERQLARLEEIAKLPGLGHIEAIEASTQLQAAGLSAKLAEQSLLAFGNALATVGKGKAELRGVTLALGQITAKGKVTAEEINQIAERVPQIRVAMQQAFGTANTEALQKMGLTARQFIEGVNQELLKLERVTGGAQNAFENLEDTTRKTFIAIGNNILPTLLPLVERLTNSLVSLTERFAALSPEVRRTSLALAGLVALAGPTLLFLAQLKAALTTLGLTSVTAGAKFGGLRALLLAAPGWTKLAVLAIIALSVAWAKNLGGIRDKTQEFASWIIPTLKGTWDMVKQDASSAWATVKDTIVGAWQGIEDDVTPILARISESITGFFQRHKQAITKQLPNLGQAIGGAIGGPLGAWIGRRFGQSAKEQIGFGALLDVLQEDFAPGWAARPRAKAGGGGGDRGGGGGPDLSTQETPYQRQLKSLGELETQLERLRQAYALGLKPELRDLMGQFTLLSQEQLQNAASLTRANQAAQEAIDLRKEFVQQIRSLELSLAQEQGRGRMGLLEASKRFVGVATPEELKRIAELNTAIAVTRERNEALRQAEQDRKATLERLSSASKQYSLELLQIRGVTDLHALSVGELGKEFAQLDNETQVAFQDMLKWRNIVEAARKEQDRLRETAAALQSMAEGVKSTFTQAFTDIQNGFGAMVRSIVDGVKQMLVQIAAEYLAAAATNAILGVIGNAIGLAFPKVGSTLGAATRRQHGGPVTAGRSYLVGERGPELFLPGKSGRIMSNQQMATAGNVTINISIQTPDYEAFRRNQRQMYADAWAEGRRALERNG